MGIQTDHKEFLYLEIPLHRNEAATLGRELPLRFQMRKLQTAEMCERLVEAATRMTQQVQRSDAVRLTSGDLDIRNLAILQLYQQIARSCLGEKKKTPHYSRTAWKCNPHPDRNTMTARQLYKLACENSHENSEILPTRGAQAQGIMAVQENFEILSKRYQSTEERPMVQQVGVEDVT